MLEMLEMEFMQRAWLAGLIMAVICPLIGSFLVLRRQSLIGDRSEERRVGKECGS